MLDWFWRKRTPDPEKVKARRKAMDELQRVTDSLTMTGVSESEVKNHTQAITDATEALEGSARNIQDLIKKTRRHA